MKTRFNEESIAKEFPVWENESESKKKLNSLSISTIASIIPKMDVNQLGLLSSEQLKSTTLKTLYKKRVAQLLKGRDPDCIICYDPLNNKKIVQLACTHVYHIDCLREFIATNPQAGKHCSICRVQLRDRELTLIHPSTALHPQNPTGFLERAERVIRLLLSIRERLGGHIIHFDNLFPFVVAIKNAHDFYHWMHEA